MIDVKANAVEEALRVGGRDLPIVALVFTPYQLLFLEHLTGMIAPRPVFLVDARPERFRQGRAPRIAGATVRPVALNGKVNDADQARLVRATIGAMEAFAGGRPFAYLCASFQWPINNVFYTRHRRDPAAHLFLIEDGLSTFLTLRRSARETVRNLLREAVARLRGFPKRRLYSGHPLGLDLPEVEGIFTGVEPLAAIAGRRPYRRLTPPTEEMIDHGASDVLFIGQPYFPIYGEQAMLPFITAVRDDLRARGFTRLAIKPHHYQAADEIRHYTDLGFELVDPPVTVEEMIPGSSFRAIASINSSALLTTRSLYGDRVQAIGYGTARLTPPFEKRDEQEVIAVFRGAGVELVDF